MKEIKPTWGEELYKDWLKNQDWQEYNSVDDIKDKRNAFVDVRRDEIYQAAVDIDFEISENTSRAATIGGYPLRHKQTGNYHQLSTPVRHSVEIKDSETAYSFVEFEKRDGTKVVKGGYLNIQIEKINDKDLYDSGETYDVVFNGVNCTIRRGVGWWIKNKDFKADRYLWFLPIFGETGENVFKGAKHRATKREFEEWRDEKDAAGNPVRKEKDKFITELPAGIMLTVTRGMIAKMIKDLDTQEYKTGRKTYVAWPIPMEKFEEVVLSRKGWERGLMPALPIVRFLTKDDPWKSVKYPENEHFSGTEIPVYEKYDYYVPARLLDEVYGWDNPEPEGITITPNGQIIVPPEAEEYPEDAAPIANRSVYGRDGSLRKLTRIAMMEIKAWPAPGVKHQPEGEQF